MRGKGGSSWRGRRHAWQGGMCGRGMCMAGEGGVLGGMDGGGHVSQE